MGSPLVEETYESSPPMSTVAEAPTMSETGLSRTLSVNFTLGGESRTVGEGTDDHEREPLPSSSSSGTPSISHGHRLYRWKRAVPGWMATLSQKTTSAAMGLTILVWRIILRTIWVFPDIKKSIPYWK